MKELSIFVDESGDFGEYNHRTPYYIISMVLHDQDVDITKGVEPYLSWQKSIIFQLLL